MKPENCIILAVIVSLSAIIKTDSLKVSIFYEALCPDSVDFITRQLRPNYDDLKNYIDVEFVPYGKATQRQDENNTWSFRCQHGQKECYGNKIQACYLSQNNGQDKDMEFVSCIMEQFDPSKDSAGKHCAEVNGDNWNVTRDCAGSARGDDLLAEMGDRTRQFSPAHLSFVPTVAFNDDYSNMYQIMSLNNFRSAVCANLDDDNDVEVCEK